MKIRYSIKPRLDVDLVYELGHWFNQWVIAGSNKKILKLKKKKYIYIYIYIIKLEKS